MDINCQECHEPWDVHHVREYFEEFKTHMLSDPESPVIIGCPCCKPRETILRDAVMKRLRVTTIRDHIEEQLELDL